MRRWVAEAKGRGAALSWTGLRVEGAPALTGWAEVRAVWVCKLDFVQQLVQAHGLLAIQVARAGASVHARAHLLDDAICNRGGGRKEWMGG